ncbi:DUF4249 domain-containing protein [Hymenobacter daecheongensis]|uniref:DUF4249 domain-containing protein n=1 Tax=Hymenobacter daecheongensis TaxID=496053 RepID=UPI0013563582|nr:DUF4249 domain-containing protein [Hymenobacter daecheongensis]
MVVSFKRFIYQAPLLLAVLAGAAGCNLQKDIDVELPVVPSQLVTECYLVPGEVPRLTVTESVPYLSSPQPSVPTDVTVVLTLPNGQQERLSFKPGQDKTNQKLYTHIGKTPLVARPGDTFSLDVRDTQGRHVTATATMPTRVPLDTVEWKFNDKAGEQRKAYLLAKFQDPAATADFYRFQIHKDSISKDSDRDFSLDDRLTNGQLITLGTSYRYSPADTLLVTLYHIDQSYYHFLESVQDARNANGNPFAQPAAIRSTVQGGVGVFTILSADRRTVILK